MRSEMFLWIHSLSMYILQGFFGTYGSKKMEQFKLYKPRNNLNDSCKEMQTQWFKGRVHTFGNYSKQLLT